MISHFCNSAVSLVQRLLYYYCSTVVLFHSWAIVTINNYVTRCSVGYYIIIYYVFFFSYRLIFVARELHVWRFSKCVFCFRQEKNIRILCNCVYLLLILLYNIDFITYTYYYNTLIPNYLLVAFGACEPDEYIRVLDLGPRYTNIII